LKPILRTGALAFAIAAGAATPASAAPTMDSPSVPFARPDSTTFPVRGAFNWGQEAAAFGGPRSGRSHEGQDVMSRTGTPVVAITGGKVLETGDDGGRGNYLNLYDPARRVTYVYMHMVSPPAAKPGQRVTAGQRLGGVGCTGSCFGDHLHFEIRAGKGPEGPARDPRPLLERLARGDGVPATLPPGQS
jgi:murein DD-endopeptidase MepM/ murein hydrolase activator NlpD